MKTFTTHHLALMSALKKNTSKNSVLERIMNELLKSLKSLNDNDNIGNDNIGNEPKRVLNLLHHFLNASESRGMGGLRTYECLSTCKTWHLTVIDKIHFNGSW